VLVRRLAFTAIAIVVLGLAAVLVAAVADHGGEADGARGREHTGGRPFVGSVAGRRALIWAVGDGADGSASARALAARIAADRPDRFLYLGDVYQDGAPAEFARNYQPVYGALQRVTAPVPGNHDARNEPTGYDAYWRRVHRAPPPDWYAFKAGGWTLLALDSEAPHGPRSAQVRWLRARLQGPGTCRLAFWHRPRFSAGRHGDQPDMAPVWDALRGRAAVVVAGHDHDMQRFRPIAGITEFVSGAGGHGLYRLRPDPRLAFGADSTFGALRLVLRPGSLEHAFVTVDGRVLDSGTVGCRRR